MKQYLDLLQHILINGEEKTDRTGTGTRSVFGAQMRFDLSQGFPLVTTKKVFMKGIVHELLWFISGSTNIKYLVDNDVHIWDAWADENGELGPVYGKQWRSWPTGLNKPATDKDGHVWHLPETIDQLSNVIDSIKNNPDSRRHIVTAWNPAEVDQMALPPCHCLFQFYIANGKLSCQLYQRSCDMFLGVPFNIASYALLVEMIANVCGLAPGDFIWTGGDCHIYNNHLKQVALQLGRQPCDLPTLMLSRKFENINEIQYEDIELIGYDPLPMIKAPIAI